MRYILISDEFTEKRLRVLQNTYGMSDGMSDGVVNVDCSSRPSHPRSSLLPEPIAVVNVDGLSRPSCRDC